VDEAYGRAVHENAPIVPRFAEVAADGDLD